MAVGHWRNTYKPVKFFFMDVRVGVVIALSLIHLKYWTIGLDLAVIALGYYIERSGLGFMAAVRAVRSWLAGTYRPAGPPRKVRHAVDYEHRRLAWQPRRDKGVAVLNEVKQDV